jgi:spore maturation protein CgeB
MSRWREPNRAAMTSLFPECAPRVDAAAQASGILTIRATTGVPVLEWDGRALDSRRDPIAAADRAASEVQGHPVVVVGLGTGYLLEALLARGVRVAAVVDRAAVLAAAMAARDLRAALSRVPVVCLESLADRARLARLRALAPTAVVHGPAAGVTPELEALADRWALVAPARAPRVLVVGPIAGGSLGIARSVARAARRLGADTREFDAAPFAGAQQAFGAMPLGPDARTYFLGHLTLLVGEAVVEVAAGWKADMVLAVAQAPLSEPALTALRSRGIATAFWFVENTRVLPYWRDVARHYDTFYAIQPGEALAQIAEAGGRPAYLPVACDPDLHRPVPLSEDERARYGSPVSFAGAPYLNRRHVLAAVRDLGLKVWGEGWEATALADCVGQPGRFDAETMVRVFCATAVNLNVHSAEHVTGLDPQPDYVNPRTFELAACGAFQLVDRRDPLAALFDADEVATFDGVRDLRLKAEHFLARPDAAAQMARRARARATREHTFDARVDAIAADLLPPELQPYPDAAGGETLDAALARAARAPELDEVEAYLRMLVDVRQTVHAR